MRERSYSTYIVASRTHVLYIGMTNDLFRRVLQHRAAETSGFTERYHCNRLVWFAR